MNRISEDIYRWKLRNDEPYEGIVECFVFGSQEYTTKYVKGDNLHRIDGPALILWNGKEKYFIEGIETTKEAQELYHSLMKLKGLL